MSVSTTNAPRHTHERHRFTGDDVLAMMRAGLLQEGGKFELIDGEIIDMPSEGNDHLELRLRLNRFLSKALPDDIALVPDGTLRLAETFWPEPDLYLYPARMRVDAVRGPDLLLLIEISDTTQRYDMGRKAAIYRDYGVREYWVIDVTKRETHVHLLGRADAWPMSPVSFNAPLVATMLPGLTIRMSELEPRS